MADQRWIPIRIRFASTRTETMCRVELFLFSICLICTPTAVTVATRLRDAAVTIPSKDGVLCIDQSAVTVPSGTVLVHLIRSWADLDAFLAAASRAPKHNETLLIIYKMNADLLISVLPLANVLRTNFLADLAWVPSSEQEAELVPSRKYVLISNPENGPSLDLTSGDATSAQGNLVEVQLVAQKYASDIPGIVYICTIALLVLGIGTTKAYVKANSEYLYVQRRREARKKSMKKADIVRALGRWDGVNLRLNSGYVLVTLQQICLMLLVLYYFNWTLTVLNIGFPILFVLAFDDTLGSLITKVTFLPGNRFVPAPCIGKVNPLRLLFIIVPISAAIVWYIQRRRYSRIWVLHNFMSATMCIWLLNLMRMPSLSVALVVSLLLALYDFFMVFLTPAFTYDGKSVMETVARGTQGEQMPMVLQVPPFTYGANYPECSGSIKGFIGMGDFIIPGFVIAYFGAFDAQCRRNSYFKFSYLAITAYVVGLIATYISRNVMNTAQPALVFIMPSLFIFLIPATLICRVWHEVWTGDFLGTNKASEKHE